MDENMTDMARELCGGCLLLDTAFPISKYFVTILWFRNPMFLQEGVPVVHPAAVLISHETKPSDYEFLLGELSKKLGKQDKICRSVLLPESVNLDALSQQPDIFHYPCIKLNCTNDFRTSLETRFGLSESDSLKQIVEEELFGEINTDDLNQSTGLLNALKFEVFVKQLSQVEKKWPAPFRTWFREKSGWIFERLSLAARLKSGFGPTEVADVRKMTLQLKDNFIEKAAILMGPEDELDQQQIISAVEEFSTELLVKCAKSLIDQFTESDGEVVEKTIVLNRAKDNLKASQTQWLKSNQKREKLLEVGLPRIFTGLSCLEKLAMLSKAYELRVHAVEDEEKEIPEGSEQTSFTVIDHPSKRVTEMLIVCLHDTDERWSFTRIADHVGYRRKVFMMLTIAKRIRKCTKRMAGSERQVAGWSIWSSSSLKAVYIAKECQERLSFAKEHQNWTVDQWKSVLWSDESKFNTIGSDGKGYVRRPVNKRFDPKYTKGTVKLVEETLWSGAVSRGMDLDLSDW
uniref:Uncharacterized protein n=1 Tax=Ditylenchus dipsaci TaxID=166011 RepID=A0A915E243_9BILA